MADQPLSSRLDRANASLLQHAGRLACPICHEGMRTPERTGISCKRGHCFDIARKGYVNFAHAGKLPHYDKALFLSRRAVFEAGFYAPVLDVLRTAVQTESERLGRPSFLLDAGCGEGYYAASLTGNHCAAFGIDLCRDAVALAARYPADVSWYVADLAHLPFADGALDIVLDVLTPANYAEFKRVLRPGGLVIKVVPGSDLREIRRAVHQADYDNSDVVSYFHAHMDDVIHTPVRYVRTLNEEIRAPFFHMTPLTVGKEEDPAALREIREITIDLHVLTGRFAQC